MQPSTHSFWPRATRRRLATVVLLLPGLWLAQSAHAQVGIGTTAPDAKAALEIAASDKGLLIPRMTATQRGLIGTPPAGLLVYQTDGLQPGFWYYEATTGWTYLNPLGDNLGNHSATQNVKLNTNWLSGDGDAEGVNVSAAGRVGVGVPGHSTWKLTVGDSSNSTLMVRDLRPNGVDQRGPHLGFVVGPTGAGYFGAYVDYIHTDATRPFRNNSLEIRANGAAGNNGRINFFAGGRSGLNPGPHATIRENGAIGIGINDPVKKLHLYSTSQYDGIRIQVAQGFGSGSVEYWSGAQGSANVWRPGMIRATDNGFWTGGLAFYTNGTGQANKTDSVEVMRLVNRRVGIGLTTPGVLLQVRDTSSTAQTISWSEGNNNIWAGSYVNAMKASARPFYGYARQGGVAGYHYISPNGDWTLNLGLNQLNMVTVKDSTGFTGLGTTAPKQLLHLYSAKPGAKIRIQAAGSGGYGPVGIEFWSDPPGSNSEWRPSMIRSTDQGPGSFTGGLAFYVNGAGFAARRDSIEVMRLTNRRVGIGTSNPVSKLHVVTDNSLGGTEDDYIFDTYGNNGDLGIFMRKSRGTVAAPTNAQFGDRVGILSFIPRTNGALGFLNGSDIQAFYMGDGTTNLSDLRFATSAGQLRMRLTETGNVGIGTFAASTRLTISSNITEPKITLWENSTTNHYGFGVSGFQLNYHVNAVSDNHVFYAGGKNGDGTELARIAGNGFVGIGTAGAPTSKLHVVTDNSTGGTEDDYIFDTYGDNGDLGIFMRKSRGTVAAPQNVQNGDRVGILSFAPRYNGSLSFLSGADIQSYYMGDGTTGLTDMRFSTNAGQLRMRLTETGNVGIATFAANTRLTISPSTTEAKITLWDGGSTTSHYGLGVSSAQFNYHVNTTADNHVFYAGGKNGDGTELMRLTGSGYLGINSVGTPGYRLYVRDTNTSTSGQTVAQFDGANASYAGIYANATVATASPFYGYKQGGTIKGYHGLDSGGDWYLNVNNNVRMRVDAATGNVAIATTPTTARLEVAGSTGTAISASSAATGSTATMAVSNSANGIALDVASGLVTLSSASLTAATSGTTLTPSTVIVSYTSNGSNAANGTVTLAAGREGQLLIVSNQDAQSITVGGTAVASGATQQYVYVNSGWRAL